MILLDLDISKARALVIDPNATSRSVTVAQLRDIGAGQVQQTGRIADARLMIERGNFDIVLCDYHFDDGNTGQDLLDELRREHLLPYATVFMLVTGEATYAKVVEAAEAGLDSYLLKPYTAASLRQRLAAARSRKRAMKAVFEALENDRIQQAIDLCMQRFKNRESYWLFAARVASELLLRIDHHDSARHLFDDVLRRHDAPWARLGVARAMLAAGEIGSARRAVESQIRLEPEYSEIYDVLGHLQVDQGELAAALETYRTVVQITPGCMLRLQHCGTLAFYQGHGTEALRLLERTMALGLKSKLFDALTLLLVALLRFDASDTKGLTGILGHLHSFVARFPESQRLRRFASAASALRLLHAGKTEDATALARELASEADDPNFDVEAANVVLALWARLPATALRPGESLALARRLGLRFSISKAISEVLLASARRQEPVAGVIRNCHAEIGTIAETAMTHSLNGDPKTTVRALLQQGEEVRNAKLIEMAGSVARRHADAMRADPGLQSAVDKLRAHYCRPVTHIAGFRRTGRTPGGMIVRT